ncbi:hypothetical protein [Glutamicibacter sp.]|uniref:hypothetical protein n=1 Tax=Glutamicibacter sp. TaxID=1931995 RepID=UPI0028BEF80A|nr:hypothetical protein [Glutamicibacter sp.]
MNIRELLRRPDEPAPGALQIAQMLWLLTGVLFIGFGAFLLNEQSKLGGLQLGAISLSLMMFAAGAMFAVLAYRLYRGERAARTQLTWVGLIAALPMVLRMGRYSLLAALVLFCVVLMWLPTSNQYFRVVSPKPQRRR